MSSNNIDVRLLQAQYEKLKGQGGPTDLEVIDWKSV